MDTKKIILLTAVATSLVTGLVFLSAMLVLDKMSNQKEGPEKTNLPPTPNQSVSPTSPGYPSSPSVPSGQGTIISDKSRIPDLVTGTVSSVESEKILIKQFASTDLSYEIKKSDIGSVIKLKKNPSFNEEKAKQKQQEIAEKMKSLGLSSPSSQQNPDPEKQEEMRKITEDLNREMAKDPSLKPFTEEKASFGEIKEGQQVNFAKEGGSSQGRLSIYPEDMNIGPPTGGSQGQ